MNYELYLRVKPIYVLISASDLRTTVDVNGFSVPEPGIASRKQYHMLFSNQDHYGSFTIGRTIATLFDVHAMLKQIVEDHSFPMTSSNGHGYVQLLAGQVVGPYAMPHGLFSYAGKAYVYLMSSNYPHVALNN